MIAPLVLSLALSPCTIAGRPAQCGTFTVPEDRALAEGRRIALRVVVLRGNEPRRPDPIVFLTGGPGQGATGLAEFVIDQLAGSDEGRDIVLVDQRGTGASNPLMCEGGFALLGRDRAADLAACRKALEQRADLPRYGTPAAVEDLEELRAALGYESINLIGLSYGTRVALVYVRRYPTRVRTLLLRAIAPAGFNVITDGGGAAEKAITRVLRDCEADAACGAAFGNLEEPVRRLRAQLAREPATVAVAPSGQKLVVTDLLLTQTMFTMLLSSESRQTLPMLLHRATTQGVETLAPVIANATRLFDSVALGMYLSVICSEDAPRVTPAQLEHLRGSTDALTLALVDACRQWPAAPVPADFHRPVTAPVPALLFSGALDPATPIGAGDEAARHLPNSRHVLLPATGHAPMLPACARPAVRRFLDDASVKQVDAPCADVKLKPFTVPAGR